MEDCSVWEQREVSVSQAWDAFLQRERGQGTGGVDGDKAPLDHRCLGSGGRLGDRKAGVWRGGTNRRWFLLCEGLGAWGQSLPRLYSPAWHMRK